MSSSSWLTYTAASADAGLTVEQIARQKLSVSGRMLQRLTRSKGIQLNRKPVYLQRQVKEGDIVSVKIADQPRSPAPLPPGHSEELDVPEILFEDEWFMVANKPAGMLVHPVKSGQTDTLIHRLAAYLQSGGTAMPHSVHRLDKETSGAVLLAKSSYAHRLADQLIREGKLRRTYLAVAEGSVEAERGTIEAPIGRDPRHPSKRRVSPRGDAAITHYQVLARQADATLLRIQLETGRTHQIRVHFAHLGHPLVGDSLYGGSKHSGLRRQALHAHQLSFSHPLSGEQVECTASLPEDLAQLIRERWGENVL
ncbi:RluA family pseudouridine synthase [Brevibacillus sp. B_LB10_24]|uniref:RluA family pseudouridine synthase n=1 Tax=Brevibacillus sp. B_LB10_24 TaxID=3380645 RepID=UPI0038B72377